jgi:adenylate cyclase
MGLEIERKFLVRGDGWRVGAVPVLCRQGYLRSDIDCTIRVRVLGEAGFLTIKGKMDGIARLEYEYPIPVAEAHELLDRMCAGPVVEKYRHAVCHAGVTWEVDEFLRDNQGLIVAEVELRAADQAIALPDWVGQEVSADPRYLNVNLAKQPYTQW